MGCTCLRAQIAWGIECKDASFGKQYNSTCHFFNFAERVRSKDQRCPKPADDFAFEEAAKLSGRQGIKAARRLVEKQHRRRV